ncbi:MAG: extracellular solute-binding protein [Clostridia bacterium]|nr:extracellular solute-binding protein [Clostridia bacterium]
MKKFLSILTALICAFALISPSFAELAVPEAVAVIGSEAFADCENAQILTVYNSGATIAEDALTGSGIHTIRCYRDAEEIIAFADRHGINVEYLDEEPSITVWISGKINNLTERQVAAFKQAYPQYATVPVTIVTASEADAVDDLQNADTQPDIFGFAQDQLAVLKNMGKLDPVINAGEIRNRNTAGSVRAAEIGGTLYGYPMTADNGFFLYYDKSVVTDPSSLESILASCEAAGKKFYMEINSGWYQIAYFFGAGCSMSFTVSDTGEFESVDIHYANENGLKAMRNLISTIGSDAFVNGSRVDVAENWAAIVSGTWDSYGAREYLGSNYAAAKMPTVGGDQMMSYGGYKMLGVTPQEDSGRRTLCHALADWLTNGNSQLEHYSEAGWGPSNIAAQQSEAVQGDQALTALAQQDAYAVPQDQIPGGYWGLATGLITEIMEGEFDDATDETILARLQQFEDDIRALTEPESGTDAGISMPTDAFMRWAGDGYAMSSRLESAGYNTDLRFADNNVEIQRDQIDEMIDEGVKVLIIAPIDPTALEAQMARAKAAGIPVISYDRLIMDSDAVSYYTTFDNYLTGVVQGRYIRAALNLDNANGPFNLEITAGDPGDNNAALFYQGAMDTLRPFIQSGKLTVKSGQADFDDVTTAAWKTENAGARAAGIITEYYANDTVHAWLCSNDSTALGVTEALRENYNGDWPIITGQDCDIENVKNIIRGQQSMSVFKDTGDLAAQAAKMAGQIINGQEVDVNDTETYYNGVKKVEAYSYMPGYVDAGNYYEKLIESGIYEEAWLQ